MFVSDQEDEQPQPPRSPVFSTISDVSPHQSPEPRRKKRACLQINGSLSTEDRSYDVNAFIPRGVLVITSCSLFKQFGATPLIKYSSFWPSISKGGVRHIKMLDVWSENMVEKSKIQLQGLLGPHPGITKKAFHNSAITNPAFMQVFEDKSSFVLFHPGFTKLGFYTVLDVFTSTDCITKPAMRGPRVEVRISSKDHPTCTLEQEPWPHYK